MHGEIDRAAKQRFVDLLGEQALAAEVAQRLVPDAIARGGDGLKRDGVVAKAVRSDQQLRTWFACHSASGLPRVPIRSGR